MKNAWTEKWDQRYAEEEFAYGEQPNNFLQQQLSLLKPGKILFPAEGEGRNAVLPPGLAGQFLHSILALRDKRKP